MRTLCLLSIGCALALISIIRCSAVPSCYSPIGSWTSGDGQELVFMQDGKGLWITTFGRMGDTVGFEYRSDCDAKKPVLDLMNLSGGPFLGKSLLGIIDWQSDSSFRWRFESGTDSSVRPEDFDQDHTLRFLKKKN